MVDILIPVNVEGDIKKVTVKLEASSYKPKGLELTDEVLQRIKESAENKPLKMSKKEWEKISKGAYPANFSVEAKI